MRRRHAIIPCLLAVIGIAAAAPSPAQTLLRSGPKSANGPSSVRLAAGGRAASMTFGPQGGPDSRSPLLASALSLLILPGIGSYYAGNSGHGMRHLLIAGASGALALTGMLLWVDNVLDECLEGDCRSSNEAGVGVAVVGGVAYMINWVWPAATAAEDAMAFNREHSNGLAFARLVAGIRLEPTLDVSHEAGIRAGAGPRAEPGSDSGWFAGSDGRRRRTGAGRGNSPGFRPRLLHQSITVSPRLASCRLITSNGLLPRRNGARWPPCGRALGWLNRDTREFPEVPAAWAASRILARVKNSEHFVPHNAKTIRLDGRSARCRRIAVTTGFQNRACPVKT